MIPHLLKRRLVSNVLAGQVVAGLLASAASLVMILGIRRLAVLELTEAQVFLGALSVMSFAGICIILALLVRLVMNPSSLK